MPATACLGAVDTTLVIESDSPALVAWLDEAFAAARTGGHPEHVFRITAATRNDRGGTGEWDLVLDDGRAVARTTRDLVSRLIWEINRLATSGDDHVMLHAAVAEINGTGVVLCAPQEAGKSTSVAGLVERGAAYLSDEVAAIDPATGRVDAYAKPITLDPGSWAVLPHWEPSPPPGLDDLCARAWFCPAPRTVRSTSPAVLALPRYAPGAPSALEPISRAEALTAITTECFNLDRLRAGAFGVLADLVRSTECFRWSIRTLDEACPLLEARCA